MQHLAGAQWPQGFPSGLPRQDLQHRWNSWSMGMQVDHLCQCYKIKVSWECNLWEAVPLISPQWRLQNSTKVFDYSFTVFEIQYRSKPHNQRWATESMELMEQLSQPILINSMGLFQLQFTTEFQTLTFLSLLSESCSYFQCPRLSSL